MSLYRYLTVSGKKVLRRFGVEVARRRPVRDPIEHFGQKIREFQVKTIFDVGANKGQFGLEMMQVNSTASLISFEPLKEAHAKLCKNAINFPAWSVYDPVALGATNEKTAINVAVNGASSSLLEVNQTSIDAEEGSAFLGSEQVSVVRFDALEHTHFAKPWAMKIDTQGFELEVLKGIGELLPHFEALLIEMSLVPLYQDGAGFSDLYQWLENQGYKCIGITQGFANHSTNELLQVDGLFVRSSTSEN